MNVGVAKEKVGVMKKWSAMARVVRPVDMPVRLMKFSMSYTMQSLYSIFFSCMPLHI